jgi:tetratricopeptide (TPR) repeat protein
LLIQVPFLTYSHNLFLSVALGLGVLGLAALLWLLVSFYIFVFRLERISWDNPHWPLFRAAWLGATATFLHDLTDAPQFAGSGWTMPMLLAVLGLAVASGYYYALDDEKEQEENKRTSPLRWWGMVVVTILLIAGVVFFWRPLRGMWYANLGAIQQTRAELTPDLDNSVREAANLAAVDDFARALSAVPAQPVANRRLGLLALNRQNFETAVVYLEQAYRQEPGNQATLKALGLAYVWLGQLDQAEPLLQQRDDRAEIIEELGNWSSWWNSQGQPDLAVQAQEMAQQLSRAAP